MIARAWEDRGRAGIIAPCLTVCDESMTDTPSARDELLYAKLVGETARIQWPELEPFFARGILLRVDAALDLPSVAVAVSQDDQAQVAAWLRSGQLWRLQSDEAMQFQADDADLWAVVVAPWVLVQKRLPH